MPEGLAETMTPAQRRDLIRFLIDLGRSDARGLDDRPACDSATATAPPRSPTTASRSAPNTGRTGDTRSTATGFTTSTPRRPSTSASSPTSRPCSRRSPASTAASTATGATRTRRSGPTPAGTRPTSARCSAASSGAPASSSPRAVCVRLGDDGRDVRLLQPGDALLRGPLARRVRHVLRRSATGSWTGSGWTGPRCPAPKGRSPTGRSSTTGFTGTASGSSSPTGVGDVEMLDAPWGEGGKFTRVVGPAEGHPLAHLTRGGPPQWPQEIADAGRPWARTGLTPSTRSSRRSRTRGTPPSSSAATTSSPTARRRCSHDARGRLARRRGSTTP